MKLDLSRMQKIVSDKKNKPKLSPEARTEMERKLINMKTRAEDRKKAAEDAVNKMGKDENAIGFNSSAPSDEEKRAQYPRILNRAKNAYRDSQERKDNKYGARYDSARKEYVYTNRQLGDELRDRNTQNSAKRDIEDARKFMKEDSEKLRASRTKKK